MSPRFFVRGRARVLGRRCAHALLLVCAASTRPGAQVLVDESFNGDPFSSWALQGSAAWVPPLSWSQGCAQLGFDPNNPFGDGIDDCTLYPDEGYVLLTPGLPTYQSGSIFLRDRLLFDDFKVTAVVELRDGTLPNIADGMCIVVVGTASPPGTGVWGGGMGATGLGTAPTLVIEFDTWGLNSGDGNDPNHIQAAWSPTGFPATEFIPISPTPYQGTKVSIPEASWPLNNRSPPPAPPNRFTAEVYVVGGTVTCYLANADAGLPRTRFLTKTIAGFAPFMGYLGVTAATGGATENHIIHSLRLEQLPGDFCLEPPGSISREFLGRRDPRFACGDYAPGDVLDVRLHVTGVRPAGASCGAPSSITVRETIPQGWYAVSVGEGGSYEWWNGTITWNLSGGALAAGQTLTYQVQAASAPERTALWSGQLGEGSSPVDFFSIDGADRLVENFPFSPCGGIRCWNILGALERPGGPAPGPDALRLDYLTDGVVFESGFLWHPGAFIDTAFGGDGVSGSAATGLFAGAPARNPDGVPQVFPWNDADGFIDLDSEVFGGNPDEVMAYAQAYVVNTTGGIIEVYPRASSDDSIQVLLNGTEAWLNSIARAGADDCAPQDFWGPQYLFPGENTLVVKVFEGAGGWNFSLRFDDIFGQPVTQGIEIHKAPQGACIVPPLAVARNLEMPRTVSIEGRPAPTWMPGATYDVSLTVTEIRSASTDCPAPTSVQVREKVPAGWTVSFASDGGFISGDTITWTLTGASIRAGKVVRYQVVAGGAGGNARFSGTVDDDSLLTPARTGGESLAYDPGGVTSACFIRSWLLLGPYRQPFGNFAAPPEDSMRADYLTDGGALYQETIEPFAGKVVMTDYGPGGSARSTGLEATLNPDLNPGGRPAWYPWIDADDTVDFASASRGDVDQVVFHALTYIDVEADMTVDIGLASDDAVQVLLDGEEVWIHSIARPFGASNTVQDIVSSAQTPALSPLRRGRHRLMVKVFEGAGEHGFRLRFQDPFTGEGICGGISLCLDPDPADCGVLPPVQYLRGDSNSDGWVSMGDAVFTLNNLFTGGPNPTCREAMNANGDNNISISDVVHTLNFLFTGLATIPGAYPDCETASTPDCAYPVSPCGALQVRLPEPTLRLEIDVERLVEEGVGTNPVTSTVVLRNTEPVDFPVRGWSLSVRAGPYPQCQILNPTLLGTLGAPENQGGLRKPGSFDRTELVSGPAGRGVVSTIILSFTEVTTLPGNEVPHKLLRFDLAGPFIPGECTPCLLEIADGLEGSGEPVRNLVDSGSRDYRPFSRPVEVRFCSAVTPLDPDGGTAVLSLPASSPSRILKIEPRPVPGGILILTLEGADPDDGNALYVRWGGAPSPRTFDHAADARGRSSQRLVIPVTRDDTCFVLVQGNRVNGEAVEATLRAATTTLALESASVDCGKEGCSGVVHMAVQGAGFDLATTFRLEAGGESLAPIEAMVLSRERAELAFDVTGSSVGAHDLVARKGPATARLAGTVEVRVRRIGPRLEASLDAPAYYREYQLYSMTLRYANTGDEEMPAPLFEISGRAVPREDGDPDPLGTLLGVSDNLGLRPLQLPDWRIAGTEGADVAVGPLHVLGIHSSGVAGRLPAGASGEIPIVFRHPDPFSSPPLPGERLEFSVRVLGTSALPGPDWNALLTPRGITPGAWTALRASLAAANGGDYHEALSEIATRLNRRGKRPWKVLDLVNFAARRAAGTPTAVVLGTARGPDSAPLATRVVGARAGLLVVACTTTDAAGAFALGPLPDGIYQIVVEGYVTPLTSVTISGGEDVLALDIQATSEDGSSLTCPPEAPGTTALAFPPGLPPSRLEPVAFAALKPSVSEDPNAKEGPDADYPVMPGQLISYTIHFENSSGIEGSANRIVIIDALSDRLAAGSVIFREFQLGASYQAQVSDGGGLSISSSYSLGANANRFWIATPLDVSLDYPPQSAPLHLIAHSQTALVRTPGELEDLTFELCGVKDDPRCAPGDTRPLCGCTIQDDLARIAAELDSGPQVVWVLEGRDPLTGLSNVKQEYDPNAGLVPPNKAPPAGQGHVRFEVRVSADAKDGDPIENTARIVFDNNMADEIDEPVRHTVRVPFRRGDATDDGTVDIADGISILNCLFTNTERCPTCSEAADADDSGVINITDGIYVLNFLFLGDDPPPSPGPYDCGFDLTPDIDPVTRLESNLGCAFDESRCR